MFQAPSKDPGYALVFRDVAVNHQVIERVGEITTAFGEWFSTTAST